MEGRGGGGGGGGVGRDTDDRTACAPPRGDESASVEARQDAKALKQSCARYLAESGVDWGAIEYVLDWELGWGAGAGAGAGAGLAPEAAAAEPARENPLHHSNPTPGATAAVSLSLSLKAQSFPSTCGPGTCR
jgi:hypothetical protein